MVCVAEPRAMSVCGGGGGGGGGALWVGCCQAAGTRRRAGGLQWLNRQCSRLDTPSLPLSALSFQQQLLQSRWRQGTRAVQDMRGGAWGRSKQIQQKGLMRMVCHRCHAMATGGSTWDMEEWRKKLPEKKVPLYSHSLPCIEAWLNSLGFFQSRDDRAVWLIQRPDWHAQLSLDITELYIRYLKSGPGNLDRDIERKFSYALSREDVENAILGGP
ncbi:unnamed protein product [Sphagnum compactum]